VLRPKTTHITAGIVVLAALMALPRGRAQDPSPEVAAAIEELGSRDDAAAARAAETLRKVGVDAEPALLSALDGATGVKKDRIQDLLRYLGHVTDEELLGLERKVVAAIRGASDRRSVEAAVRREVEAFATDHAPPVTRTHGSSDGTIVISIGHGGKAGEDGTDAAASDARAALVVAIGGQAGAGAGRPRPSRRECPSRRGERDRDRDRRPGSLGRRRGRRRHGRLGGRRGRGRRRRRTGDGRGAPGRSRRLERNVGPGRPQGSAPLRPFLPPR